VKENKIERADPKSLRCSCEIRGESEEKKKEMVANAKLVTYLAHTPLHRIGGFKTFQMTA
jgi:hypothetical protein